MTEIDQNDLIHDSEQIETTKTENIMKLKANLPIALIISLAIASLALAQTTEFTYQGNLKDGATNATGDYDFEFALFDALSGGAQLGSTLTRNGVAVANAVFSVKLDFGSQFPGANRFLEIRVRVAGGGAFTPLAPRQLINSSPYSVRSLSAETAAIATSAGTAANATNAATATNALQLGGVAANQYVLTGDARLSDARPPTAGSSNYIQNQSSAPQTSSNFNISGTGTANILSATAQYNLGTNRVLSDFGSNNLFAGIGAGAANTTGNANAFFGKDAGQNNTTGTFNAFFGALAGRANSTGGANTFIGGAAGRDNTTGSSNTFVGEEAGIFTTTGRDNTFVGTFSGVQNLTGNENTYVGAFAGQLANSSFSTFMGFRAGYRNTSSGNAFFGWRSGENTTTGSFSAFFGGNAGNANTTGAANSFFGNGSGAVNVSGGGNSFFGAGTGNANQTGSNNSAFGLAADFLGANLTNATAIGAYARVDQSNSLVLGSIAGINAATSNTNVGIGTTAPTERLHVVGNGLITGNLTVSGTLNANITGNFIQNTTSQQANSNFNISGNGIVGGNFSVGNAGTTARIFLNRASAIPTNSADINFYSAGAPDFSLGTSQGSAPALDLSIYSYGTGSNVLTIERNTGKIGIGTTNPEYQMHAVGSNYGGVRGTSAVSNGVYGSSTSSNGVQGDTSSSDLFSGAAGVKGNGSITIGVWGNSNSGTGVYGTSNSFNGGDFHSTSGYGLHARSEQTHAIYAEGSVRFTRWIQVDELRGGGGGAVCWNSAQELSSCASSSIRYKTNIGGLSYGLNIVRQLQPITFDWKLDGTHDVGLVAEEVEKIAPRLSVYDKDGKVDGVKYDKIGMVLINAVKEQQTLIEAQARENSELKATVSRQQKEIDALKAAVCEINTNSSFCRK